MYVGCCGSELHAQWLSDIAGITGYEQTGCTLSMFANRLSFTFDFRGPSKAVDTGAPKHLKCMLTMLVMLIVSAFADLLSFIDRMWRREISMCAHASLLSCNFPIRD